MQSVDHIRERSSLEEPEATVITMALLARLELGFEFGFGKEKLVRIR